jgi:16S rRNA (cytidine1402-2'-O)-methyltransferase
LVFPNNSFINMVLYLIPTFISENTGTLPESVLQIARSLDEFVVEDEKSARAFLKSIQTKIQQNQLIFHLLNEHSTENDISFLSELFKKKNDIGLLSEAGCPAVADPGSRLIRMAHEKNVRVIPLAGPSSILLALMSSGMNGQSFVFHGYLPRDLVERKKKISSMETDAIKKDQTQIFMEAPYRNSQLLNDVLKTCNNQTRLCIACDVTSEKEFIQTKKISEWTNEKIEINKRPVIFLIGK